MSLYPEGAHWWSRADHDAVLSVMQRLQPRTVLEFGPGTSTLALIEGGARRIDCCEDDPHWLSVHRARLAQHLAVELFAYEWRDPIRIRALDERSYDMALIDGPLATERRCACIEYSLHRCAAVLVPLEEEPGHQYLRPLVIKMAEAHSRAIELIENAGPLAGAWALLT